MPHDPGRNKVPVIPGNWSQHVATWSGGASECIHVARHEDMIAKPSVTFAGGGAIPGTEAVAPEVVRTICSFSFGTMQSQAAAGGFNGSSEHP